MGALGLRLRNARAHPPTVPGLRRSGLRRVWPRWDAGRRGRRGRALGRCGAVALGHVLFVLGAGAPMVALLTACTTQDHSIEIRQWTNDLAFRITVLPSPPVAEEDAIYKIVVQDKNTGQPIESGAGRIFASNQEQARTDDGLAKGKEIGTYYARLRYPVSGDWAVGLQFRRDSLRPLDRTLDWVQTVSPAPALGTDTTTHSH
ncbi:MAG TPA: hypothetical protein VNU46_09155 [Gemmatimonadaceae bacterium]|nr:hypothetical protein [Gemmatimonadaceae bacterium]